MHSLFELDSRTSPSASNRIGFGTGRRAEMNRSAKRHRSTKVPNVKLRPAPVGTSAANEKRRQEAEAEREDLAHYRRLREAERTGKARARHANDEDDDDDDDDEDGNDAGDDDKPPLLGCVICTTGITEEKAKLIEYATMLGGTVKGNLTEDTTHLIAVEPGSEKYRCAVTLGLPILRPEWLKEIRARWTGAIDYDFDGLMEEHRLDTFERVVAALAGITEPSERTEVRKKLKSGSALTPTTFSLDGTFTHLICQDVKRSQTMEAVVRFRKKAERFTRRGEEVPEEGPFAKEMKSAMQLKAVWVEWVDDCLEVQACINESYYSVDEPRMSVAQRRDLIESIKKAKVQQMEISNTRKAKALQGNEAEGGAKKAITQVKETPSNGNNDVQRVTKRPKIDIGQYVQQLAKISAEEPVQQNEDMPKKNDSSSLIGMNKAQSFAEHLAAAPRTIEKQLMSPSSNTVDESTETLPLEEQEDDEDGQLEDDPAAGLQPELREKSLSTLLFRLDLRDEVANNAVRTALERQGVDDILEAHEDRKAHFHIMPLGKERMPITNGNHLGVPVTRFFIERCLYESRVLSLNEHFALQPAVVPLPLPGADKVFVGLTGFSAVDNIDRTQAEQALRAAGMEPSATLRRGYHTHLLIGKEARESTSSQLKIQRAKEWGIHCVGEDFINRIYRQGVIEPAVSKKMVRPRSLLGGDRGMSRGASMGAATLGETQRFESQGSLALQQAPVPLGIIEKASNLPLNMSRPWQRSASSSQALLDGEVSRGISLRARYSNVESLEAGSQAIKTSAEEVMALLSSRDTSFDSEMTSSTNARKRSRLPPSRLRERRAGSATTNRTERTPSEIPTAEELLAMRKEEEDRIQANHSNQTQTATMSTQEEQSMRVTYDDPASRRERRKIGDMIATSVKDRAQQEEGEGEGVGTRSSSTEVEEDQPTFSRTSSMSPSKRRSIVKGNSFSPSIKARRQPGTCLRD